MALKLALELSLEIGVILNRGLCDCVVVIELEFFAEVLSVIEGVELNVFDVEAEIDAILLPLTLSVAVACSEVAAAVHVTPIEGVTVPRELED